MEAARKGLVLVALSAVSFGGVAVLTKLVLGTGLGVLPLSFWRWTIALAALAPLVALTRGLRLPRRAALAAIALGMVGQFATSGLYTASLAHLPPALASFLLFTNPAFVALLAAPLLGERLGPRGLGALGLSLGGLALLALAPGAAATPVGVALAVASALGYASTIVVGRRLVATEDPLRVAAHLMLGACVAFGLGALASGDALLPAGAAAWGLLAVLGVVSTALSIATFYLALPLIGAPRAALLSTLEPVSTLLLSHVVVGEVFTPVQGLGAGLVLLAVVVLEGPRWERGDIEGAEGSPAPKP